MKIGKKYAQKLSNEPVDVWFTDVAHLPEADKLKLYAQFCRAYVGECAVRLSAGRNVSQNGHKLWKMCYNLHKT